MRNPGPGTEAELHDLLTTPTPETVDVASKLDGDLLILGSGGKMGPTLAVLAHRSLQASGAGHRVICVSRFSNAQAAQTLQAAGIHTMPVDLLAPGALDSLPDCTNVVYLAGTKFGTAGAEARTWATNTYLPGLVAYRYRHSRIVALSTGNVYPFVHVTTGGADESLPVSAVGEYAQSCVGRERMFEFASVTFGTPVALLRLFYANDLRYGVLLDVALKVYHDKPVAVNTGAVNVIWQGDANCIVLQAFAVCASPPRILNLTGPETVSVRWLARQFGQRFDKEPLFSGVEADSALLGNAAECHRLFGYPHVSLGEMIDWTARWVDLGGRTLAKPTHYETRDGKF
jgi:nucleoside-diphosphate-sugar epimerase